MGVLSMKRDPRNTNGAAATSACSPALGLVAYGAAGTAFAQTAKKAKPEPGPDPIAEIEKLRAEFEQKLKEQETAAQSREEALKKEQAAAVEAAGRGGQAHGRGSQRATGGVLRLQKALDEAAAREMRARRTRRPLWARACRGVALQLCAS